MIFKKELIENCEANDCDGQFAPKIAICIIGPIVH